MPFGFFRNPMPLYHMITCVNGIIYFSNKITAKTLSASNMRATSYTFSGNSAMVIFSVFALVLLSKKKPFTVIGNE
jgi:hypothetical protein